MVNGERSDCLLTDAVVSGNKRRSHSGSAEAQEDGAVADGATAPEQPNASGKLRKKKKKQKNKKSTSGETSVCQGALRVWLSLRAVEDTLFLSDASAASPGHEGCRGRGNAVLCQISLLVCPLGPRALRPHPASVSLFLTCALALTLS